LSKKFQKISKKSQILKSTIFQKNQNHPVEKNTIFGKNHFFGKKFQNHPIVVTPIFANILEKSENC